MTTGTLIVIAAIVLITFTRIPWGILAVLAVVWLIAFNQTEPGVIGDALGEAWAWAGVVAGDLQVWAERTWAGLPRTSTR